MKYNLYSIIEIIQEKRAKNCFIYFCLVYKTIRIDSYSSVCQFIYQYLKILPLYN